MPAASETGTETIDLPHGTVRYRAARPDDGAGPPVVFVHGFLVNSSLWTATADALGLPDVNLVGNDTGCAICQFLLDSDAARIGRVVLTNCHAFADARLVEIEGAPRSSPHDHPDRLAREIASFQAA